jgi:putative addiction module killer protein
MVGKIRSIVIYRDRYGKVPFSKWFSRLRDEVGKHKIMVRLDRLEHGNFGDYKILGSGVFELRINFGPGYRVYYGEDSNLLIILLMGGDKSSQNEDIEKAKKYWENYQERKKDFSKH